MKDEMLSPAINETWVLVSKPRGVKNISCKWLYKITEGIPDLEAPGYKSRLVAKEFT